MKQIKQILGHAEKSNSNISMYLLSLKCISKIL